MTQSVERVPFRQTSASVALDATRGVAALLVLFDHTHNLFFLDFTSAMRMAVHPRLTYLLYALSSAGREAVVIFFVLSGYLISGSVFRAMEQGRWSWKDYLTHRLVRLWLVLLPALLLCTVWDASRLAGPQASGTASMWARMAASGLTFKIFAGNVLFVQSIHVPYFGSNRVLWSLAYEFWYYMLFPMGLLAVRRGTPTRARVGYAAGFLLIAVFVGQPVMGLFPVWLFGTLLARMKPPQVGRAARWAALLLFVPVPFVLAMTPWPWRIFKLDYVLGVVTLAFLWVMLSGRRRMRDESLTVRAARGLAGCSYSLYLVHYPFLAFVSALVGANGHWAPQPRYFGLAVVFCAVAVLYGYGVAACTELRNDSVRRWVEARLNGMRVHELRTVP